MIANTIGFTQGKGKVGTYQGNPGKKPFGSAFTLGACKTTFFSRTKRRNRGSTAQTANRDRFRYLTEYYKSGLPSGIKANWKFYAANNTFVTQRQKSFIPATGMTYFLAYAIPTLEFGTGGSLDVDPSTGGPNADIQNFAPYYLGGVFYFPACFSVGPGTGNDIFFVYSTSVGIGGKSNDWYKLSPAGWNYAPVTGPAGTFDAQVTDDLAASRTTGEIILIDVVCTMNGANAGHQYFGALLIQ
jgi:hypothetical protein